MSIVCVFPVRVEAEEEQRQQRCGHTHPCWPVQYLRDPHSQNVGVAGQVLAEHGLHGLLVQVHLQLLVQVEVVQRAGVLLQGAAAVPPGLAAVGLDRAVQPG